MTKIESGPRVYTPYESKIHYEKQYPDIQEFKKPLETCIQVDQNHSKNSLDGRPLQSENFSSCIAMILRNKENLESALFHIEDIDIECEYLFRQSDATENIMKNHLNRQSLNQNERTRLLSNLRKACQYEYPSLVSAFYGMGEHDSEDDTKKMEVEELQEKMQEFNKNNIIQARFVSGTKGSYWIGEDIKRSLLDLLRIKVKEDIIIDTENGSWSIVYFPKTNKILVDSRSQKKVLTFNF